MSKIDQLLALYAKRQQLVDRLADIDTFAAHLDERMRQVYESRSSGWKRRIDMVEPFRCARNGRWGVLQGTDGGCRP